MSNKVYENLVRRKANRRGFRMSRNKRRDKLAIDYGVYWLAFPDGRVMSSNDLRVIEGWIDNKP